MKTIRPIIFSLLLVTVARGGFLTSAAKISGKIAEHGADNVVEHVVTHYGDDATRAAVRSGGGVAAHAAPKVAKAVDATVDAVRLETCVEKHCVGTIHRAPIVKPTHLTGAGIGIATIDAAHNLTVGERARDQALAGATRETIAKHPELLVDVVRADGDAGFWNHIGAELGRASVWFAAIFGGLLGISGLIRVLPTRRHRKTDFIDVTTECDS